MRHIVIALMFIMSHATGACAKQSICLNMIVKDESAVICRCLQSVKPIIDYWVIVDTGSTDGTQDIIRNFMKDIPGELHERPWKNFEHNRNQALELAKGKGDYVLFIDADERLAFSSDFVRPLFDKDFYYFTCSYGGTHYRRIMLINNHLDWRWIGVLHETVCCKEAKLFETLPRVTNVIASEGARSRDPLKFQKDAAVLEKALIDEPNNARYVFYLAQSYRDAQDYERALYNYHKRVAMGGWKEEVFYSLLQMGILYEILERDPQAIIGSYYAAHRCLPRRAEPLYRIASFHRRHGNYQFGYNAALQGLALKESENSLFSEFWVYDYGLLLEFSICACGIEKYHEALLASHLLLANASLPNEVRECVQKNLSFINEKLETQRPLLLTDCLQIGPR